MIDICARPGRKFTLALPLAVFSAVALFVSTALGADKTPATADTAPPLAGAEVLRGIRVVGAKADAKTATELLGNVQPTGVSGLTKVSVEGPPFLKNKKFEKMLGHYLGSPLTTNSLHQMQVDIIKYCRDQGHIIVDVFYPEQDIVDGAIQIAVIEARVSGITVTNANHKWFSDKLILREFDMKTNQVVTEDKLNRSLAWLNRNNYQSLGYEPFSGTFRTVDATFKQGDLGSTDIELRVEDRFPVRAFAGVDDTGITVIGNNRVFAGFEWANVAGLDQRLNYEFLSSFDFDQFREHIASYTIPLPWRHELTVFGAYANINPNYAVLNPVLGAYNSEGTFAQGSLRYAIPLSYSRTYDHEVTAGFDFKHTDTPLVFQTPTASSLLATNNVDVFQFMLGYNGRLKDQWGRTAFYVQGFYSPGNLNEQNSDAAFNEFARGSNPRYLYARAELRRETLLPAGFTWFTRLTGQISDAKLIATESYTLGGYDTVRGYDERIVSGDYGFLVVNELRTKQFDLGNLTPKLGVHHWIQGLVFCDYGGAYNRQPLYSQPYNEILLSVGVGFRYQFSHYGAVRFDYGWELDTEYQNAPGAFFQGPPIDKRAHFGVELSF